MMSWVARAETWHRPAAAATSRHHRATRLRRPCRLQQHIERQVRAGWFPRNSCRWWQRLPCAPGQNVSAECCQGRRRRRNAAEVTSAKKANKLFSEEEHVAAPWIDTERQRNRPLQKGRQIREGKNMKTTKTRSSHSRSSLRSPHPHRTR